MTNSKERPRVESCDSLLNGKSLNFLFTYFNLKVLRVLWLIPYNLPLSLWMLWGNVQQVVRPQEPGAGLQHFCIRSHGASHLERLVTGSLITIHSFTSPYLQKYSFRPSERRRQVGVSDALAPTHGHKQGGKLSRSCLRGELNSWKKSGNQSVWLVLLLDEAKICWEKWENEGEVESHWGFQTNEKREGKEKQYLVLFASWVPQ